MSHRVKFGVPLLSIFEPELCRRQPTATTILRSAIERQRLANAYLLLGRAKSDKWSIARQVALYLNCSSGARDAGFSCATRPAKAPGQASGLTDACQSCRWITEEKHPQAWLLLTGEGEKSGRIPVARARQVGYELARTSPYQRVVVIPEAGQEIFHRPAANALLKTIEEAAAGSLFFLFAPAAEDVLATVVSRCQLLPVLAPGGQADRAGQGEELPGRRGSLFEALEWGAGLVKLAEAGAEPAAIIDSVVSKEVGRLKERAADDPPVCLYLSRLLEVAEASKEQVEHFVPARFVLEAFAVAWHHLQVKGLQEA